MKIKTAARIANLTARETVAFIHNRHCSRVPLCVSLSDAVEIADSYRVDEDKIAEDILAVDRQGDLAQYVRNWVPYRRGYLVSCY
jgi:hypothetical protein